ncbi:hypothetical protein BCR36DRAFT_417188 [Piromyces finnis]|uniref:Ion transport domain-containing protein n=1 Tax=Piromyces finnis TaxID=1754191 RepID=A0A1Y1UD95_9FUNG|nr:hypothetical protein BCR36DRAFT_417188 [Piromyces finnis]|eukprot:ORX35496.1 hypothetical protein BCR36DRAFT_417188 [Piromyces finnis]
MEPSQDQSFHIQLGGEGYYTNDKEYQKELTTYQRLQLNFGHKFFKPKYITSIVIMTIVDFFIIIVDLVMRLYTTASSETLIKVEKVISYILIALRSIYLVLLIIKLILSYKKLFRNVLYIFDAIVVTASFVLVILFNGLNRIAFSLVIVLRLSLTIQMIRNSNKRTKEKQEDELNEYSLRMDEELQKKK